MLVLMYMCNSHLLCSSFDLTYPFLEDISILGNLLLWAENKQPHNSQEIGSLLDIVPNGYGTQYMQGIIFLLFPLLEICP